LGLLAAAALAAVAGVSVCHLPSLGGTADMIVVMMEDGLLPEEPWEGLSSYQREEFWTLACSGMMVQRAAWSGYVIICPAGTGRHLLETAGTLAAADGVPDGSSLCAGLELVPASECSSVVLLFSGDGSAPCPGTLPLRRSLWLEREPDTLMIQSPEEGNAFFWTGHPDDAPLAGAAWRGTGTEMLPSGEGSVELSFSCVHGSVPSNLLGIVLDPHPMDEVYMETWGAAFAAVDSLIAGLYPEVDDSEHLLWIRGEGFGRPWRTAPSPTPPPSASYGVVMPCVPSGPHPLLGLGGSVIPNAERLELPGVLERHSMAPVLEAVLERMIARDLHAGSGQELLFDVEFEAGGTVAVWLVAGGGMNPAANQLDILQDVLRNSLLVPPGRTLIGNSVIRASFMEGRIVDSVGVREVSMELMNILYPEE